MSDLMFYFNWGTFIFYTVGAIGGVIYLVELFHDYNRLRSMRKTLDHNDPYLDEPVENIVHLHQRSHHEAPISARHK